MCLMSSCKGIDIWLEIGEFQAQVSTHFQVADFDTGVRFVLLPTRSVRLGSRFRHWCALRASPDSIRSLSREEHEEHTSVEFGYLSERIESGGARRAHQSNGSSREEHEEHTSVEFGYLSERIESGGARRAHQSNGSSREEHEEHTSVEFGYLSERIESGGARRAHQSNGSSREEHEEHTSVEFANGSSREEHEEHTSVEFGYLSERIESGGARRAHQC
ncbi:hypothetical protein T08_13710 [Trichinella sp. T8]|nr:hypothetical protein T08_13710 [Trichinella sp. T8]